MTMYYERSVWTSAPRPVDRLVPLDEASVRGVAVHFTGSSSPLGPTASLQGSAHRLEEVRTFHAQVRGWSDIAYQCAVDVDGRVFDCRGIGYRPAANGNARVNEQYGAVTWLLGAGDQPTTTMVEAFRDWRRTRWLARYPHATGVVGHRDLYPTECPGEPTYALIRSGVLTAGGTVPLTDAEIDAIATRTRDKILGVTYGQQEDGRPFTLGMLWGEVRVHAMKAATGIDLDALASAIVAKLPAGAVDPQRLAAAVADELAMRLNA
ncbi:MAG TPA: peptidoglycan recognition family protein [Kineosporiaceae bacterium]